MILVMLVVGVFSLPVRAAGAWVDSPIYRDNFSGGTTALLGTTPDITDGSNTWGNDTSSSGFMANGSFGSGSDAAMLAFTPVQGNIYTLSTNIDVTSGSDYWMVGFFNDDTANNLTGSLGSHRLKNDGYLYSSTGLGNVNNIITTGVTAKAKLTVVLDCTDASSSNWTVTHYLDDVLITGAEDRKASNGGNYANIVFAGYTTKSTMSGTVDDFELVESVYMTTAPAKPTGIAATPDDNRVDLSWSRIRGTTTYSVKRHTSSGGPYTTIGSTAGRTYQDTTAVNGTTYYYVVSAVNAIGESADSSEVSAMPALPAPDAPTGLTATPRLRDVNSIDLWWNASSYAASYNVKRSETSGGPYTALDSTTTTTYHDATVIEGTTYYYVVSAVNATDESADSNEVSAKTGSVIMVLYQDDFDGGAVTLLGTTPDITMDGNTWGNDPVVPGIDAEDEFLANGTVSGDGDDSAFLAFTPAQGSIYTLIAELDTTAGEQYMVVGFFNDDISNALYQGLGYSRLSAPGGNNANKLFVSPGLGNTDNITVTDITGEASLKIILDCRNYSSANWRVSHYLDGELIAGAENRTAQNGGDYANIAYVGMSRKKGTDGTFDNFKLEEKRFPCCKCGDYVDPETQAAVNGLILDLQSAGTDAERISILADLAALGPNAATAIHYLLSDAFFRVAGGGTAIDDPVRMATLDTLIEIGGCVVPEAITMLTMADDPSGFSWSWWGAEIMRKMSLAYTYLEDIVLESLEAQLAAGENNTVYINALALMGPDSVPILAAEAQRLAAVQNPGKLERNNIQLIAGKIGPEIGDAINVIIPESYTPTTWADDLYWIHYTGGWEPLALARPDANNVDAFLDLVCEPNLMLERWSEGVRYLGRVLSRMEGTALPLAELLSEDSTETRWAAGFLLAMVGPDANAALDALYTTFSNPDEDIMVRVSAARAIAEISGASLSRLYDELDDDYEDFETELVDAVHQKALAAQSEEAWTKHFALDPDNVLARHLDLYNLTPDGEQPLYDLATNTNVAAANAWLSGLIDEVEASVPASKANYPAPRSGIFDSDLHVYLMLFGSDSKHYPGRLTTANENAIKDLAFQQLDTTTVDDKVRFIPKSAYDLQAILDCNDLLMVMEVDNNPIRNDAYSYLMLQALAADPAYANDTFATGDTVSQRYNKYNKFYERGIRQWSLHGLWVELGSANYEHKTYRGLYALVDFAKDPNVSQLAKMYMDLSLIESAQISLSGLRGGSKSRCKDEGMGSRWNRSLARLYGEYHGFDLEPPDFNDTYQAPAPAILLRHLGPTDEVYEIINRHPSEGTSDIPEITQYDDMDWVLSKSTNYAYCTPDYITGCSMFDVRLWENGELVYAPLGRWSGVIFRDGGGIYMDSYTGEKWNVQSKDVMIAQRYKNAVYDQDEASVDFVSGMDMVESGGWVFVSNDRAYAAVKIVSGGYYWREPARTRLWLNNQYSPIVIQTGRNADYGSFANFQSAILAAPYTLTAEKLDYTGPNSSRIEFFLADDSYILPKIDGVTIDFDLQYNYHSPYMQNEVGSDVVTVTYGDRRWEYDFAALTITEISCGDWGYLAGDVDHDCDVDIYDLSAIASEWLNTTDLTDFAELAGDWLKCTHPLGVGCVDVR